MRRTKRSSFVLSSLFLTSLTSAVIVNAQDDYTWNFDGCAVDTYYSSLSNNVEDWTKEDLETLLFDTHRNSLVYTRSGLPGVDDVWAALIDVDVGSVPETVKRIYTDDQIDSIPFGQRRWIKEHIWPILNITEQLANEGNSLGKHVTDMHNIRPVDPLSAIIRADKLFGECGVLSEDPEKCQIPAEGGAADTCVCQKVYTPPQSKKGEISRALLYMDVRYGTSGTLSLHVKLTDCPRVPFIEMGYLSQMLQWHFDNPPTAEEVERNNKVCTNWQGNRNPFVDYPELASVLYYEPFPLPVIGERTTYEACDKLPSLPPTPSPNICDTEVFPSDIYIWLVNSMDPDTVAMYTFRELPEGLELYMTDNPWNGTEFVEDLPDVDGTLKLTIPEGGIASGTALGYGDPALEYSEAWEPVQGNFSLTADGEAIFLYCLNGGGTPKPLLAFSYGATLEPEGQPLYNETSTSYPKQALGEIGLQNIVPPFKNVLFNRTSIQAGISISNLKAAMRDPANFIGNNRSRFGVEGPESSAPRDKSILFLFTVSLTMVASGWMN